MTGAELAALIQRQRAYWRAGHTLTTRARRGALATLADGIRRHESNLLAALKSDLGKPEFEGYSAELALVQDEIAFMRRRLHRWTRPRRVGTLLAYRPARNYILARPLGVSAVLAPWNYPIQLALAPLAASIAAGNCTILKPSELAPASSRALAQLLADCFGDDYVAVLQGGPEVAAELTHARLDHLFFTGSTAVGRKVMQAAAEHLVPVTLELGGKSPAIVTQRAAITATARRIAWGRFVNAGQTCVAPDYVVAHESIAKQLVTAIGAVLQEFYGDVAASPDYGRIVSQRHWDRLDTIMQRQEECCPPAVGGARDRDTRFIAPTVYFPANWEDPVMEDELFGPILPVLTYRDFEPLLYRLAAGQSPLAAYLHGGTRAEQRLFEQNLPFGGASINDSLVHLANPHLPFGGRGASGMGAYHGRAGFEAFSHTAAITKRPRRFDIKLRYPPYRGKLGIIRRLMG